MSVRASSLAIVVLSIGITCAAQLASPIDNSSRFGASANSDVPDLSSSAVTGTIQSLDGLPVADARVEIRSASGELVNSGFTDRRGMFVVNHVSSGAYEIIATKSINEARDRIQVAGMETTVNLRMGIRQSAADGSTSVSVAQFKVPDKARKIYAKGNEALRKNKLDDAKKYAEKALEIYPHFAEALTLRGILKINDGAMQSGMADFQAAITADPSYALAYTTMGAAQNRLEQYDDAIRTLLRAVSLQPNGWQAYYELAKASLGKGDYKTALTNISRACEISQEYAPVHLVKAHALLGLKLYQQAVGELELYLTREPSGAAAESARKTLTMAKSFVTIAGN